MTYDPRCELCGRLREPRGCVCQDPGHARRMREHEYRAMPFDGRICPVKPQDVVATTKRERDVYRGGPREIRE